MFKNKKYKTIFICVLVAAALIVGVVFARKYVSSNKKAAVALVADIADTWGRSGSNAYGQVTQSGVQTIYLDKTLLLEKTYVSEGDQVKKGDEILKYDTTQARLKVESYRIQYEITKNNYDKAVKQLEEYKTYTPFVKEVYPSEINDTSIPDSGTGTAEDPYIYQLDDSGKVTLSALNYLITNDKTARIDLYHAEYGYHSFKFASIVVTPVSATSYTSVITTDFEIADHYNVDMFAGLVTETVALPNVIGTSTMFITTFDPDDYLKDESEMYTRKQIESMIAQQEQTIAKLEISVKQAELDYRKAKNEMDDGIVRASNDGVVTLVADSTYVGNDPYIVIKSSLGYEISTTLNEYQLKDFNIGDTFDITMWSNGNTYTATIKSISQYPVEYSYSTGLSNSCSDYEVYATLDCEDELREWDGGEITFNTEDKEEVLFSLYTAFIKEENGKSYVMKVNSEDRIEKVYIKTGGLLYGGYYTEVLEGISLDDYIAFPYGNGAVEGAKADYEGSWY